MLGSKKEIFLLILFTTKQLNSVSAFVNVEWYAFVLAAPWTRFATSPCIPTTVKYSPRDVSVLLLHFVENWLLAVPVQYLHLK